MTNKSLTIGGNYVSGASSEEGARSRPCGGHNGGSFRDRRAGGLYDGHRARHGRCHGDQSQRNRHVGRSGRGGNRSRDSRRPDRLDRRNHHHPQGRRPDSPLHLDFARAFGRCVAIVAIALSALAVGGAIFTTNANAIEAPFIEHFKCSRCTWTEDSEGTRKLLGPSGETLKEWTAEQWEAWKNEINGVSKAIGESSPTEQKLIEEVPGITQGEAEDAVDVVEKAREAGSGLGSDISGTLDFAGEAGGSLALGAGATALGGLFLGPTAFHLGVDIGNALDSFFGLPTWEAFKEEASEGHDPEVEHEDGYCVPGRCEATYHEDPGFYVNCYGGVWSYHQEEEGGPEPPAEEGCKPDKGLEAGPIIEVFSKNYKTWAFALLLCAAATAESGCSVNNSTNPNNPAGTALTPEGVPRPGGLTKSQEEGNEAAGLSSKPKVSAPTTPSHNLTTHEIQRITEEKTTREYIERESPHKEEYTTEPAGGIGAPTLPGFKIPSFGALCEGFPFGVPCWLFSTIESWSGAGSAPEWGIEGFSVLGHEVHGTKFKLSHLEPIMEKARIAMLLFCTIGLVLLFYNFAKGGSPPSGGGIGDTGGKEVVTEYDDDGTEYRVGL